MRTTNSIIANKSICANCFYEIDGGKVIIETISMETGTEFHIPGAKLAFIELRQALRIVSIFYHLDSKFHIWIRTNALSYAIGGIFFQLTWNNRDQ